MLELAERYVGDPAEYLVQVALLKATGRTGSWELDGWMPWNITVRDEYGEHGVTGGGWRFVKTFLELVEETARAVKPLLHRCEEAWDQRLAMVPELKRLSPAEAATPRRPLECHLKDAAIEILRAIATEGYVEKFRRLLEDIERTWKSYTS